jgi:ribonuclease BN (tRNA processing enzyme)
MPSPSRFCSSLFVQTEGFNFLLDCGEGTSFSLLRNRIDPQAIDSIFISHTHIDHPGGLFLLVQMMHLLRRNRDLNLYVPEEAVEVIGQFLNTCYLSPDIISFRILLEPITAKFEFEHDEIIIKAYPNRHLMGSQRETDELKLPLKMQSFCCILNLSGKKIVYSGDIASADDLAGMVEDADLLITECFHPRVDELFGLITDSRIKSAVFTHIPAEMEEKEKDISIRAKSMGVDNFILAYDGLTVAL